MFFDPCDLFVDFLGKCTFCRFPIHIAQEGCYIRVKGITFAFRILARYMPKSMGFFY